MLFQEAIKNLSHSNGRIAAFGNEQSKPVSVIALDDGRRFKIDYGKLRGVPEEQSVLSINVFKKMGIDAKKLVRQFFYFIV